MRGQKARSAVFDLMTRASIFLRKVMDCRVKPGNDELNQKGETNG
jgi:hypothetical protein